MQCSNRGPARAGARQGPVVREPEAVPSRRHPDAARGLPHGSRPAIKFTDEGRVRVAAEHDVEVDEIVLAVEDTGIGISTEQQKEIFAVESTPGAGSTFTVRLPRQP